MGAYIPRYTDFSGGKAVFEIFISIDGHIEKGRRESVDHRWATNGPSVGMPSTIDGHRLDPMESQYRFIIVHVDFWIQLWAHTETPEDPSYLILY